MKEQRIKFWSYNTLKNEIIFILGLSFAFALLLTVEITEYWGLHSTLVAIIAITLYYSITFFKDDSPWMKLYFYVAMLPFLIGYFALMYKSFGIVTPISGNEATQLGWLDAFYFSTVTWTTLGYGDFRPNNDVTKLFVMTEALLGYIYMGVFIGKLLIVGIRQK